MAKAKKRKKIVYAPPKRKVENLLPEQEFFRKIEYPGDFRRNLLEGSKSTLSALKGVYAVKEVRQKKLQKLLELQRSIREIRLLMQKAEELMPKYTKHEAVKKFPHLAPKKEPPKKVHVPAPAPTPPPKKHPEPVRERSISELDKLSDSIANIEKKIKAIPEGPVLPKGEKRQEPTRTIGKSSVAKDKPAVGAKPASGKEDDLGLELGRALDKIHKKLKEM